VNTYNKEKQENAYYLKSKFRYSVYYSDDIRKLFEERYCSMFSGYFERKISGLYVNDVCQTMWEGFINGFRTCEDLF
jgi:hypothetical protein